MGDYLLEWGLEQFPMKTGTAALLTDSAKLLRP